MDIVSWVFTNTSYDQHKPIFIDVASQDTISASQARSLVRQLIAGLRAAGLQDGEIVGIISSTRTIYSIFVLAVIGARGVVVGGNPRHTESEHHDHFVKCSVKYIITESPLLSVISGASTACGIPASNIYLLDDPLETGAFSDFPSWTTLLQHGDHDWAPLTEEQAATTTALLYQTSGTSGMPKYAAVSHSYFMANGAYIQQDCEQKPYDIRRLVALPLFHAFAGPLVHVAALRCGTPTYLLGRYSVPAYLDAIRTYQITDIPVVPSILIDLASQACNQPAALSSLREVVSAGAPLTTSVVTRFKPLLPPRARLIQVYGLTEVGWVASTPWIPSSASDDNPVVRNDCSQRPLLEPPTSFSSLSSSSVRTPSPSPSPSPPARTQPNDPSRPLPVGSPLPTYTLLLIDPHSSTPITAPNTPGELLVHTPHPFLYYLPESSPTTAAAFTANQSRRWLRTGDLATLNHHPGGDGTDTSDTYTILDRLKDVIKVIGGWQVAPAELEGMLLAHPRVADAAVVGSPDGSRGGEVPVAFVVLRTQMDAEVEDRGSGAAVQDEREEEEQKSELMCWVGKRVARYKALAGVRFVEQIPRSAAGKVLRVVLKEKVRKESEGPNGGFGRGIEKVKH